MKNIRSVLARMEEYSRDAECGGTDTGGEANGSQGLSLVVSRVTETMGVVVAGFAGLLGPRESSSSVREGKGLLANGGIVWSEAEKSNGAGWEAGLSLNQTSLYS
jgi:hypothetical protein